MILFRPVGLEELRLIDAADMRAFPPRLPEQPIFYPVLIEAYARQIARDWNTKSHSLIGFVTRFAVDDAYVAKFERHIVGGRAHEELWVPAEDLHEFNRHIVGRIDVVAVYFGDGFCSRANDPGRAADLLDRLAAEADGRADTRLAHSLRGEAQRLRGSLGEAERRAPTSGE
ncbi:MAG: ADP-ribosylation/crystallin J1 [Planctomycetes bacterium]|nr:ADP-ribosylation/crystallin J1 [Planctomycetota bacterium]